MMKLKVFYKRLATAQALQLLLKQWQLLVWVCVSAHTNTCTVKLSEINKFICFHVRS